MSRTDDIARALAAVPSDKIVRSGRTPAGKVWARCVLCSGDMFHELTCPWFQAFCWVHGMSVEDGDHLARQLNQDWHDSTGGTR